MEYLKTYEDYVFDMNEGLILENIEETNLIKRISKEFNINVGFILTYGVSIAAFLPIVGHIIKNMNLNIPISHETVILLGIAGFCVVIKETDFSKIKKYIEENNLSSVFKNIVRTLSSLKNIYDFILNNLKKSVEYIIDVFSYTSLSVPFINVLSNLINSRKMTIEDVYECGLGIGLGLMTIVTKNIIKTIWMKFKKYLHKFISKDVEKVEESLMNI